MLLFLLPFLFFLFSTPALAQSTTPTVSPVPTPTAILKNIPSSATVGDQFHVEMEITNAAPSTNYHVKIYGGVNGVQDAIDILSGSSWYNTIGDSWDKMPTLSTDGSGHVSAALTIRAKSNAQTGSFNLIGQIQELSLSTNSYSMTINSSTPTNTPTPTPTNTPMVTPTPIASPTPKVSPTPLATATPEPIINDPLPTDAPTSSPTPNTSSMGLSDVVVSVTPVAQKTSFNSKYLPFVFISAGGLLLLIPLLVSKLKK